MATPVTPEQLAEARRGLGQQLADHREAAGLTQAQLGGLAGYTRSTIANLETGRSSQPRTSWVRYDQLLNADGILLAGYDRYAALAGQQRREAAQDRERQRANRVEQWRLRHTTAMASVPQRSDSDRDLDDADGAENAEMVRRTEFLKLTGAVLTGVLAPPLLHGWREPESAARPAADETLPAGLRAQTESLRWLDRRDGAADLLVHTIDHARTVTAYWRSTATAQVGRELAEVAADACHLVAYQTFDQGERTSAIEWYRCAVDLAAHARNQDLFVFALCGVAYMHARDSRALLSLSVLRQLTELPLSAVARYYVAVYEAHAHAAAGDEYAAMQALDRAAGLAERDHRSPPAPWLGMADPMFVERQRGIILASFGTSSGIDVLAWLDENTPDRFQRYRVTLLTNQAELLVRRDDLDGAAHMLGEAARRNTQIRSREKLTRILAVRARLKPLSGTPTLQQIDDQLRAHAPYPEPAPAEPRRRR